MTAAAVAQRLGLSGDAITAFTGSGAEFAQHFGVSLAEGEAAVADSKNAPGPVTGVAATVVDVGEVNLAFTLGNDGGTDIEEIVVTVAPAIALNYDKNDLTSPVNVQAPFASGVAYTLSVAAKNAVGTGVKGSAAPVTPNP